MRCKALKVTVEVELQAITCPGVWLCPIGYVTANLFMLGTGVQTTSLKPLFPILCHEKFRFHQTFYEIKKLKELDTYLTREFLYVELIQWKDCDTGILLATFRTNLSELLYPPPWCKGAAVGVDVDLLMEATRRFPGIIAPKLELSTKTTIEEILCKYPPPQEKVSISGVKPKHIGRTITKRNAPIRQRRVCHTFNYHQARSYPVRCDGKCRDFGDKNDDSCVVLRSSCPAKSILKKASACSCVYHPVKLCHVCRRYKTIFNGRRGQNRRKVSINDDVSICDMNRRLITHVCSSSPDTSPDRSTAGSDSWGDGMKKKTYECPYRHCSPTKHKYIYDIPKHRRSDIKIYEPDDYTKKYHRCTKPERESRRKSASPPPSKYSLSESELIKHQRFSSPDTYRTCSPVRPSHHHKYEEKRSKKTCPRHRNKDVEQGDVFRVDCRDRHIDETPREHCSTKKRHTVCCESASPRQSPSRYYSNKPVRKKNGMKHHNEKINVTHKKKCKSHGCKVQKTKNKECCY